MQGLDSLGQAVLDDPILVALREQAACTHVTHGEYTGAGFLFWLEPDALAPPPIVGLDCRIGDVDGELEGLAYGAGFLLHIRGGRLELLEGFSYEEPWPTDLRAAKLTYRAPARQLPWVAPQKL
jgi:hypothetical protein